jgi:ATP-dependent exoDNAse (exonuclease V) beta subunit
MTSIDAIVSLSKFNKITFFESNHVYKIDGVQTTSPSVTKLLSRFKKPFDVDSAAIRTANKRGVSVEQVKHEWSQANLTSTVLGSLFHKYVENFFNGKRVGYEGSVKGLDDDSKASVLTRLPILVEQFKRFQDKHKLLPVKNELIVGDLSQGTNICGMVDMLTYDPSDGSFSIYDFKTNKKISDSSAYKQKFLHVLSHLDECELNAYTLQLNIYKYLIEQETDIRIKDLHVLWFNVDNKECIDFPLANMQSEVAAMLDWFKQHVGQR